MIVKIKRVDRAMEIFQTASFCISDIKDFHENLVSVKIMADNGKVITKKTHWKRWLKSLFKKGNLITIENSVDSVETPEKDHTEVICEAPKDKE